MSGVAHGMFADLGSALRLLREAAGLTQAELAQKAGMGKSQLSKYENGKELPKLETLERLLEVLDTEPADLVLYRAPLEAPGRDRLRPLSW